MSNRWDEVPAETSTVDDKTEDMALIRQWVLHVSGAAAEPDTLVFTEPIFVGSDSSCDVTVDDAAAPPCLRLVPTESCVVVEDGVGGGDAAELSVGSTYSLGRAVLSVTRGEG